MSQWLRSITQKDIVELVGFQYLISGSGHVVWAVESPDRLFQHERYVELWYEVLMGRPVNEGCVAYDFECDCLWRNEFGGIEFGLHQYKYPEKISCRWYRLSYPTIVWPLTLFSACLILWPGKRSERNANAPRDSGATDGPSLN